MTSYVDVSFHGLPHDGSIEASIQRWVARLEAMRIEIQRAQITVEPSGRRRTAITLTLLLLDGSSRTVGSVHADAYVAVADAFRAARKQFQPAPQSRVRTWAVWAA